MSSRKIGVNTKPEKSATSVSAKPLLGDKANLIFIGCIILVTIIVFWRTTSNGFTDWDDDLYVVNSSLIRSLDSEALKADFTSFTANLYTPLVTISYAIDYKMYGMNPSGFHLTNLLIHILNVVLVYILTYGLFRRSFVAGLTALLFAIHPLQTEAVVWVSSRKDLLFTFFYLAGLLAYLSYLSKRNYWLLPRSHGEHEETTVIHQSLPDFHKYLHLPWFLRVLVSLWQRNFGILLFLTFVFFILSVLSKPIAFTFPVVLLWLDYFRNSRITKTDILRKIPFIVVTILVGFLGVYLVREYDVFATAPAGYNFFDKICLAAYALAFYVYNAFIPAGISNYHAYPFKDGSFLDGGYILSPLLVIAVLYLVYKGVRSNFILVSGLILFLIVLGPTLRLIPTGYPIAADRYFYLASIGLFWSAILTFEKIASYSFALRSIVIAVSVILVTVFVVVSWRRVPEWKDSVSLWNSTLKKDPYHEMANDHLGKLYDKSGKKDEAFVHFQRVVARNKTKVDIMNSLGNILIDRKQPDQAMQYFDLAISTGKADHLPYYNRGMLYSDKKEFPKAIADFDESLKRKPDFAEAFNNRGIAKVRSGDTLGAFRDFTEAVRYNPNDQMMQTNLARVQALLKSEH